MKLTLKEKRYIKICDEIEDYEEELKKYNDENDKQNAMRTIINTRIEKLKKQRDDLKKDFGLINDNKNKYSYFPTHIKK